jgi:hypothetical protein
MEVLNLPGFLCLWGKKRERKNYVSRETGTESGQQAIQQKATKTEREIAQHKAQWQNVYLGFIE